MGCGTTFHSALKYAFKRLMAMSRTGRISPKHGGSVAGSSTVRHLPVWVGFEEIFPQVPMGSGGLDISCLQPG